ncbi:unnamed protein product, partial [Cyprideis torosa]
MTSNGPKDETNVRVAVRGLLKGKKLGEGAFAEVFSVPKIADLEPRVVKVVPFGGDIEWNGSKLQGYPEILSEVLITSRLSNLRDRGAETEADWESTTDGFIKLVGMFLVEGSFPKKLLKLWDQYDKKRKNGSENDRPDYFPDNQLYICYEFEYG